MKTKNCRSSECREINPQPLKNFYRLKEGTQPRCKTCDLRLTLKNNKKNLDLPDYGRWRGMIDRCYDKYHTGYKYYGDRGITVFGEWFEDHTYRKDGYKKFHAYISTLPNYGKQGYTIDRIDNDGNYEPGNLRWADKKMQIANQRGK